MKTDSILAKASTFDREPASKISQNQESGSGVGYNLYTFQQKAMPILLGWGVGSIITGFLWTRSRSQALQALGNQFIAWGAVDGSIAAFAIANAAKKSSLVESGEITPHEHYLQAEQFERIIWVNALLDIGYMLGGFRLARGNPQDRRRQGMGWGILTQGAFLFAWDILLALIAQRHRRGP
jgi:hypothetical protein